MGPRRSCRATGASTVLGTPAPRRRSLCTSTDRGSGRWTATTTTPPVTTFAIGSLPKERSRPTTARKEHKLMSEQNKENMRRVLEEAFGQGKVEVIDEVLHSDFVCWDPNSESGEIRGADTIKC